MFDFCFAVEFWLFVRFCSVCGGTRIKIRLHLSYDGDGDGDGDYASSEADNPLRILGY